MFAEAQDAKTGKVIERVTEQYVAPSLQIIPPKVGQEIVLCAVETLPGEGPSRITRYGRVTRLGLNLKYPSNGLRIYTDIDHTPSFVGAPVLDLSRQVIGIVSLESVNACVLIPSRYLKNLRSFVHLVPLP